MVLRITGHKAIRDSKRCAWCGHEERDEFPLIPLGIKDPKWVHYQCVDDYHKGKRHQATEEDKQERPYLYTSKSRWK